MSVEQSTIARPWSFSGAQSDMQTYDLYLWSLSDSSDSWVCSHKAIQLDTATRFVNDYGFEDWYITKHNDLEVFLSSGVETIKE